jgi:hypothetical protein
MDAKKIYDAIIEKAKLENRKKGCGVYYEKHHILPKSIGGTNDAANLVLLTAKEHYICHRLLTLIYPNSKRMAFAFWSMCRPGNEHCQKHIPSGRAYAYAREQLSKTYKGKTAWNKDKKLTEDQLAKHATRQPGYTVWNKGKKTGPQSEETKSKRSAALKGRPRPPEVIAKIQAGHAKRKAESK